MIKDTIIFNNFDGSITIHYQNYGEDGRNYGELFDFLGDSDIITASELGKDFVVCEGDIYLFTNSDERVLKEKGSVTIQKTGETTEDYEESNQEFYNWYN